MKISFIAAVAENYVIGKDGDLPWRLPSDLKWFKRNTLEKPCLMGRKTYESLGSPLPSRRNIVLTSSHTFEAPCEIVHDLDSALELVHDAPELMILGGATLYEELIDRADRFYLTVVHARPDGDTRFPAMDAGQWRVASREFVAADDRNPIAHTFFVLERETYGESATAHDVLPAAYRLFSPG
ncbi:MAG: type 3 dihydrofolate reductase [bacterium]